MNEGELKLVELDPDKQYVIMFRGNAYNFRWPDKPANVSDILLNADHYTIEDLEMALEALKKGGQMDSSKEFEDTLKKHSHYDRLGVETVELPLATVVALHHKATQARVREVLERLRTKWVLSAYGQGLEPMKVEMDDIDNAIDAELSKLGEQE